ncbi:MAG: hypothetical protein GX558_07755 [Clostridiales bacterium]|nr:hypothetical protein [Clostridiales bacterium]
MPRLWVKALRDHRIASHQAIECAWGEEKERLIELLKQMDYPAPMWLEKHEREFASFRRTSFTRDHFVEDVAFDQLEVEYLADDGVKRKSRDPRNQF